MTLLVEARVETAHPNCGLPQLTRCSRRATAAWEGGLRVSRMRMSVGASTARLRMFNWRSHRIHSEGSPSVVAVGQPHPQLPINRQDALPAACFKKLGAVKRASPSLLR